MIKYSNAQVACKHIIGNLFNVYTSEQSVLISAPLGSNPGRSD